MRHTEEKGRTYRGKRKEHRCKGPTHDGASDKTGRNEGGEHYGTRDTEKLWSAKVFFFFLSTQSGSVLTSVHTGEGSRCGNKANYQAQLSEELGHYGYDTVDYGNPELIYLPVIARDTL